MNKEKIVQQTAEYIKAKLSGEGSGHDWWHIYRVWKNALNISKHEKVDTFVVELATLLHDIADWKFHNGDDRVGPRLAREWLEKLSVDEDTITHVCQIMKDASFKGVGAIGNMKTIEGMVVQDADRLDAIGAIGIARTFAYGGHKNQEMHNPNINPKKFDTFEQYLEHVQSGQCTTINHFYEKLLLLKGLMNTDTAKKIAGGRHHVMENFLKSFFQEWEGTE